MLPKGTALFINGADVKVLGANPDAPILKMAYEKEVEKSPSIALLKFNGDAIL